MSGKAAGNICQETPNFVLEPAALLNIAACRESLPVDLFLRLTGYLEGDRLVEFELRAAVERGKVPALELELHGTPNLRDGHGFRSLPRRNS